MNKDKLLAALNDMQEGKNDAGLFHDEIETLIELVGHTKDEDIVAAWENIHTDDQETE